MVIVYERGDEFWIDSLDLAIASVAAGGFANVTIPISRAGTFLAGSCSIDTGSASAATAHFVNVELQNQTGGNHMVVGDRITGIRIRKTNGAAAAVTFGAYVILFMRKNN